MIQQAYITEWRHHAPWQLDSQIEQDLVISRAIAEIYSVPLLTDELAFRGGTALSKLYFPDKIRYSEDIDLVRVKSGEVKKIIVAIQNVMDGWLGNPNIDRGKDTVKLIYRFASETPPITPLRLKIEINTREQAAADGFISKVYKVESRWFTRSVQVKTYQLEELLATKLRALYQRKKGRDLLDLHYCLLEFRELDLKKVIQIFLKYIQIQNLQISRAVFEENLLRKMQDHGFLSDTRSLLANHYKFDPNQAFHAVSESLIRLIPGKPWKGEPKR